MSEPLARNAALVARREFVERVRSRAYVASTAFLVLVAVLLALVPIGLRALDRGTVTRIAVVAPDDDLAGRMLAVLDSTLNLPPEGQDPAKWEKPFRIGRSPDDATALAEIRAGRLEGALVASRRDDGGLAFVYHSRDLASSVRTQLVGFGALSVAILDWSQTFPDPAGVSAFHPPTYDTVSESSATEAGRPIDEQLQASRVLLATLFIVLIFITMIIYGMWVASSVAAEKGSRVMELLVSAATPSQLLLGKVVGVGAAGLLQYVAILVPALAVTAVQGRIAGFVLGADATSGAPLAGLTLPLLLAYGMFFVLGFLLYAFLYAAAGSLVSRLEDVQQLAMPMSFLSIAGYLAAILGLSSVDSPVVVTLSYIPFFSPFVMLGRVMVGRVEPWELGLSVALLVLSIALALWVAARVYAAGVLMYGQRPGVRSFLRAVRAPR